MSRKKLEEYFENYQYTNDSLIRKDGDRLWIPDLFCHNGHSLKVDKVTFDGLPGFNFLCRVGGEGGPEEDIFVSPIINDARKKGTDQPEGTRLQLICPVCKEELKQLVPCSCRVGAYRRAVYLTPDPDEMGAVGVCEIYGCPQSFVTEEGELLYEVVVEGSREQ
jgi:hypothetical protein